MASACRSMVMMDSCFLRSESDATKLQRAAARHEKHALQLLNFSVVA